MIASLKALMAGMPVADEIYEVEGNPELASLIHGFRGRGMEPGGKYTLSEEEYRAFRHAVDGKMITWKPGGSAANIAVVLQALFGSEADFSLIGAVGKDPYGQEIRKELQHHHIQLVPKQFSMEPETAVSLVFRLPSGEKIIASYMGRNTEILDPRKAGREFEDRLEDEVRSNKVLLVGGSIWQKFAQTRKRHLGFAPRADLGMADRLMQMRWQQQKELWLMMPVDMDYAKENAEIFRYMIPSANLIMGNEEELTAVYSVEIGRDSNNKPIYHVPTIEEALNALQKDLAQHVLQTERRMGRWHGSCRQMAFITLGARGSAIVTADGVEYMPAEPVPGEIVNKVGAGDITLGGFIAGYVKDMEPKKCARIGMILSAAKLTVNGPRLPNPKKALEEADPALADELFSRPFIPLSPQSPDSVGAYSGMAM